MIGVSDFTAVHRTDWSETAQANMQKFSRDIEKFLGDKFADYVNSQDNLFNAPILTDCPVNIECTVIESSMPGTHELFIGKVEKVHVDEEFLGKDGKILWDKMDLM